MRKLAIIFAAIAVLAGCQKESLPNSKWVTSLSDQGYVMEFTSDSDVRIYECDSNYNYWDSLQEDTYTKNGNNITFGGAMDYVRYTFNVYKITSARIDGDVMTVVATKEDDTEEMTFMRID